MAYTSRVFKTKKAFKDAVAAGQHVTLYSPGPFPPKTDGTEYVEGPEWPLPHRWYAQVTVVNGVVTKVK